MAKSKYLSRRLLDHTLGVAPYAAPAAVYLALFSSTAGLIDGSLVNEMPGYERVAVSFAAATATATGGQALADADVLFDPATTDWGPVVGWAIMDAAVGGNVLYHGEMPKYGVPLEYKRVYSGDRFFVRTGELSLSEE